MDNGVDRYCPARVRVMLSTVKRTENGKVLPRARVGDAGQTLCRNLHQVLPLRVGPCTRVYRNL
jgi:hypothetical protein